MSDFGIRPSILFVTRCMVLASVATALAGCAGLRPDLMPRQPSSAMLVAGTGGPIAQPDLSAPKHVHTFDYFADHFPSVTWALMAPWLNWADVTASDSFAAKAIGLKTVLYTNPNRQAPGDPLYTTDETTFAHDCSGARITYPKHPGAYMMDPHSLHLHKLWKRQVATVGGQFDAILEDTALVAADVVSAQPCSYTQSDWTHATNQMDYSLNHAIIWNSNLDNAGDRLIKSPGTGLTPSTIGGMSEGCYAGDASHPKVNGPAWLAYENTELDMIRKGALWVCRGDTTTAAGKSINLRTYMVASFFLTYDYATSILSEKYSTLSGFREEPESELVLKNPLVSQPYDVSSLAVGTDLYGRRYGACYLAGTLVGKCAVVINVGSPSVSQPFPWPGKYNHTILLKGSGILDGGSISVLGVAPPSLVLGDDAVIAFQ